jgi:hypothetical protein
MKKKIDYRLLGYTMDIKISMGMQDFDKALEITGNLIKYIETQKNLERCVCGHPKKDHGLRLDRKNMNLYCCDCKCCNFVKNAKTVQKS